MSRIKDLRAPDPRPEPDPELLREMQLRLRVVHGLLELFGQPTWPLFEDLLQKEERMAIEMLITGEGSSRERVRYIRHLLALPHELENERARLTAEISAQQEA